MNFLSGMVLAGTFLDSVQDWPVFKECPEIFILIPALLGLKGKIIQTEFQPFSKRVLTLLGNLEMTLASRLSTEANLGSLDNPEKVNSTISIG